MALTTATTIKNVARGGLVPEDVMNKIWDISKVPLPLTDMIGTGEAAKAAYKEWTTDKLNAPNINNAVIDGSDATGNDATFGARVGNHCQISTKNLHISTRADTVKKIGRTNEMAYQLQRRQHELRRDVEATIMANQASVADNGVNVAGKVGTLPSWITTTHVNGTAGGFNTGTGLTAARTVDAKSALTETKVKNAIQSIYEQGGDVSVIMSVPSVISRFSEFMFSSTHRSATVVNQITDASAPATALAAINVYVTDFGTVKLIPNRLQQTHLDDNDVACADVFLLDTGYLALSYLKGYSVEDMAKAGLSDKKLMSVDWTLMVLNEAAQGIIGDIDTAAAMTV